MKKSASKSRISSKAGSGAKSDAVKGLLIVLSAPSGCGKTTIVERLLKRHPDEWVRSVSVTTRAPRAGEKDGEDYFFVDAAGFKKLAAQDALLEHARVFGQDYGTPRSFVMEQLEKGKKVILAIDVQGTRKVKKAIGQGLPILTVFVLPPSVKVLRERLEGRNTESPAQVDKRIEVAQEEIKEARFYDRTVINQNLEQSVLEIEAIIEEFEKERKQK